MASTSCASRSPVPMNEASSNYHPYPSPLAKYEEVVASPKFFMFTLEKLHASMGTKFMIPIIGGRELDLHRLFVEVTSRGGIEKIIRERRWKEVTAVFNFPSTATNASFVLRKYYASLLFHYEQIYYFKAHGWIPTGPDALHGQSSMPVPAQRSQFLQPSPATQSAVLQQSRVNATELPEGKVASSSGSPVIGVIDGKFESGYLVTVTIGSEKLNGVLYQAPQIPLLPASHHFGVPVYNNNASALLGVHRRRRRKKSEIKRRDPAHPKPNRSGYNFFFAEQHARLKPLHQGKDREISRMIGELWNKLKESEKAVYQEKAVKDKERYRAEMEDYREKLKMGHAISDAVPLQLLPQRDTDMVDAEVKMDETEAGDSPTPENDSSSDGSDYEDDKGTEKDLGIDASPGIGVGAESSYLSLEKGNYELLQKREGDSGDQQIQNMDDSKNMLALL